MNKKLLTLFVFCLIYAASSAQKTDTLTTASGIKYYFLKKGKGPALKQGWVAIWHYQLTLSDGKKIDSSPDRGTPLAVIYPTNKIINGMNEVLSLMHIGDQGVFIIPSSLGYGSKGWGAAIPPNSTLIFNVELLGNKEKTLEMVLDSVLYAKSVVDTTKINMEDAVSTYQLLKKQHFKDLWVSEEDLNTIGYDILAKFPHDAVVFFKLNVELYPQSWNVHDSLGDGYMAIGENNLALKSFETSVKLNPKNTNGLEMIKKIKAM